MHNNANAQIGAKPIIGASSWPQLFGAEISASLRLRYNSNKTAEVAIQLTIRKIRVMSRSKKFRKFILAVLSLSLQYTLY